MAHEQNDGEDLRDDPLLVGVPLRDGRKVLDACVLIRRLGKGGMGAVYLAHHQNLDLDVAVKVLRRSLAEESPELVSRFEREARIAARIKSDHLVGVLDVRRENGLHWIVMEFVDGETIADRVARCGPLPLEEAIQIAIGAAKGLAAAHAAGVVHRDIKPANLMISSKGVVKVADLGLARSDRLGDETRTASGVWMGTPQYMAPEQFENFRSVGPPADVWSLGATLYFMLSGRSGVVGDSWSEVMRRVVIEGFPGIGNLAQPEYVLDVIRQAVGQRPEDRHADASEFLSDLEDIRRTLESNVSSRDDISDDDVVEDDVEEDAETLSERTDRNDRDSRAIKNENMKLAFVFAGVATMAIIFSRLDVTARLTFGLKTSHALSIFALIAVVGAFHAFTSRDQATKNPRVLIDAFLCAVLLVMVVVFG